MTELGGATEGKIGLGTAKTAPTRGLNRGPSIAAVPLRWWRLGCGLLRAMLRLSGLGLALATALAHAAIIRWTACPAAAALARSRARWFHRWSVLACSILGLQIQRDGFVPVSGVVVINHISLIDVVLLSSVAPFVFVADMRLRQRPIIGCVARLAGVLFRDRRRYRDVSRITFMIARALKRRQLVVLFRSCEWRSSRVSHGFPSALLQPAAEAQCSLTAAAIHHQSEPLVRYPERHEPRPAGIDMLMQPHSLVTITFRPPTFHCGDRKQLAEQIWREVQALE